MVMDALVIPKFICDFLYNCLLEILEWMQVRWQIDLLHIFLCVITTYKRQNSWFYSQVCNFQDHPLFVELAMVMVVIGVVLLHDFVLMYVVDLMQERRDRERRRSLVHPRD